MASVAIGLFAGIFVLGLYDGMMKARVRTVIDSEVAHLQIHHPEFKEDYNPAFILEVDRITKVLRAMHGIRYFAARSVAQGMLSTTTGSAGVKINGVDAQEEDLVSALGKKVIEGKEWGPERKNGILIGKKLADKMKVRIGSKLVLTFTDRESNITAGAFRVSGIYQTDNSSLDELNVYVNRHTLNDYLGTGAAGHEIAIILQQDEDLETVKQQLQERFAEYTVQTWKETSPETNYMVSSVNQSSLIIIIIIMLALAFGIINTMLMSVLERTREIGMLAALGMNRVKVFFLVLSETVMLTLVGVPLGFVLSWFTIGYLARAGIDISSFSGKAMSGFGFSSIIYPAFPASRIIMVMTVVVVTALLSAVLPSWKAIKLQPADALRQ